MFLSFLGQVRVPFLPLFSYLAYIKMTFEKKREKTNATNVTKNVMLKHYQKSIIETTKKSIL